MRVRQGFTLPQLIVVILVLTMLICLLIPAIQHWREKARLQQTMENLKCLGLAAHVYNDRFKQLPPAHDGKNACQVILAPGYQANYDILLNPSDYSFTQRQNASVPWTSIAANYYIFGTDNNATEDITAKRTFTRLPDPVSDAKNYGYTPLAVNTIRDGTSNTIMWVTCLAQPNGKDVVTNGPGSTPGQHTGPFSAWLGWEHVPPGERALCASGKHAQAYKLEGIQVGSADGSVHILANTGTKDNAIFHRLYYHGMLPNDNYSPPWDY
jgi:type II secretory pathway pseudopilin PulG